jgi:tetratricopeptide (TPR) repeat protein
MLLERLQGIAITQGATTARTDEFETTLLEVMRALIRQLDTQGSGFRGFEALDAAYQRHLRDVETDPDAPIEVIEMLGRAIGGGLAIAGQIVLGAPTAAAAGALADQGGAVATYLARKLPDERDVELVRNPVAALTPLFLRGIEDLSRPFICLVFDTFEQTRHLIEPWLFDVVRGRYGSLPATTLFVISGQEGLEESRWARFGDLIDPFEIDAFSEDDAREYLRRKGIEGEALVNAILEITGRLPLLLATLAAQRPSNADEISEPNTTAIQAFLKLAPDAAHRQAALSLAVPRFLNRDIADVVLGSADTRYQWLLAQPFVDERSVGWIYHAVVRPWMLREKARQSPEAWKALQLGLAEYYEHISNALAGSEHDLVASRQWRTAEVESLYHRCCAEPEKHGGLARFVQAFDVRRSFGRSTANALGDAARDTGDTAIENVADLCSALVDAIDAEDAAGVVTAWRSIQSHATLDDDETRAVAHAWHGRALLDASRIQEAIVEFDAALALDSYRAASWADRSLAYIVDDRNDEALHDLNEAIERELRPRARSQWRLVRAQVLMELGRPNDALVDIEDALEGEELRAPALAQRGRARIELGETERGLEDIREAVELDIGLAHIGYKQAGRALISSGDIERGIACFRDALRAHPPCLECWSEFATAVAQTPSGHPIAEELALVGVANDDPAIMACQAEALRLVGELSTALELFDASLSLRPDDAWTLAHRGACLRDMGRFDDAVRDLDRSLELEPARRAWVLAQRALALRISRRFADSLDSWDQAIQIDKDGWLYAQRAYTRALVGDLDASEIDLATAEDLAPDAPYLAHFRISILQQRGDDAAAIREIDALLTAEAPSAELLVQRARSLTKLGRGSEALDALREAQAEAPQDASIWEERARLLRVAGAYDEALTAVDEVIGAEEDDSWTHYLRGQILAGLHRPQEAISALETSLKLDGAVATTHAQLASILRHEGDIEGASKHVDLALQLDPAHGPSLIERALLLMGTEDWRAAADVLSEALNADAKADWAYFYRACCLLNLGEVPRAQEDLKRAGEALESPASWRSLAKIYDDLDRPADVAASYERLAQLTGADFEHENALGLAYSHLQRFGEALELYDAALERDVNDLYALYNKAVLLAVTDDDFSLVKRAASLLHSNLTDDSPVAKAYGLGGLAATQGDVATALQHLAFAVETSQDARRWAKRDIAWTSLRHHPEFESILAQPPNDETGTG